MVEAEARASSPCPSRARRMGSHSLRGPSKAATVLLWSWDSGSGITQTEVWNPDNPSPRLPQMLGAALGHTWDCYKIRKKSPVPSNPKVLLITLLYSSAQQTSSFYDYLQDKHPEIAGSCQCCLKNKYTGLPWTVDRSPPANTGAQAWSLVQEDSTGCGQLKLMDHSD